MRFDQPRGFRKSMSWLHTWGGLLAGWLLFAIFVTGTLSFFRQEITVWMQPELHTARPDPQGLDRALAYLEKTAPDARRWSIEQPNPRSPVLGLTASNSERDRRGSQISMDPATGEILNPRETAGGRFFVTFHYQLHGMGPTVGRWIVGVVTMAMFVALITGVIIHRQIFKDFFTFRPGKGKRSWLDAHNATGVLALPFYLVITFSGLLLLGTMLLPSINWAAYNSDPRGLHAEIRGQAPGGQRPGEGRNMGRGGESDYTHAEQHVMPVDGQVQQPASAVVPLGRDRASAMNRDARRAASGVRSGGRTTVPVHEKTPPSALAERVPRSEPGESGERPGRGGEAEDAGRALEHRRRASGVEGWSRPNGEEGERRQARHEAAQAAGEEPNPSSGESRRPEWQGHASGVEGGVRPYRANASLAGEQRGGWHQDGNGQRPIRAARLQGPAADRPLVVVSAVAASATAVRQVARVALTDLEPLLAQARERWPVNGVQGITITNPGKADAVIELREAGAEHLSNRGQPERLRFNGVTGEAQNVVETNYSLVRSIFATFQALHLGTFALPFVRWLLFASGVLGCVVIASGLVIWVISRQKDIEALGRKPFGHRLVEMLNVPAVAGVLVALAAYFWANRLIPTGLEDRSEWEIRSFLIVWGLTLIHAALRPYKQAWVEQLSLAGTLTLLLPVLNASTGGVALYKSFGVGQWQVASFDLCALLFGGALIWAAQKVWFYVPSQRVSGKKEDKA